MQNKQPVEKHVLARQKRKPCAWSRFVLHINKVALSIFLKVCWASQPVHSIDCASSLKHQKTTVWIDGLVNLFSVIELSVQTLADKLFEDYLSQFKINLKFKQVQNNSSNAFRICWPRQI